MSFIRGSTVYVYSVCVFVFCLCCVVGQVRHLLDGRVYAIKKIQLADDPRMKDRITREVELLSQMNHENVVR